MLNFGCCDTRSTRLCKVKKPMVFLGLGSSRVPQTPVLARNWQFQLRKLGVRGLPRHDRNLTDLTHWVVAAQLLNEHFCSRKTLSKCRFVSKNTEIADCNHIIHFALYIQEVSLFLVHTNHFLLPNLMISRAPGHGIGQFAGSTRPRLGPNGFDLCVHQIHSGFDGFLWQFFGFTLFW